MEAHLGGGEVGMGGGEAFAIHVSLHDYIKSMFCHIWLMYHVFFKTGLKYENRQKWSYYKEWSIFNKLLKEKKWSAAQKCTDQDSATFCNQCRAAKTSFVLGHMQAQLTWKAARPSFYGFNVMKLELEILLATLARCTCSTTWHIYVEQPRYGYFVSALLFGETI